MRNTLTPTHVALFALVMATAFMTLSMFMPESAWYLVAALTPLALAGTAALAAGFYRTVYAVFNAVAGT
jgi:hypothetical protein